MPVLKLGRLPETPDARTLRLATYTDLAYKPPVSYWPVALRGAHPWQALGNDRYGDCTIAAAAHHVQAWEWSTKDAYQADTDAIIATYLNLTGGQDTGLSMLTALRHWRNVGIDRHRIDAFVQLDQHRLHTETRQAVHMFGGSYLGIGLPAAAERQWNRREAWSLRGYLKGAPEWEPWSWGGHAVSLIGYGVDGYARLVTWGRVQLATWAWVKRYVEEAYAMLSSDWTDEGRSPTGFDRSRLERDLSNL